MTFVSQRIELILLLERNPDFGALIYQKLAVENEMKKVDSNAIF
ncbi:hypothetical protein [Parashewanella curva]|nr:hypothetical protein [Parashewanella curva]